MKINRQIILASSSPRRKELLEQIGLSFTIHASNFPEIENSINPEELAIYNAKGKAEDVAQHYEDALVIGVDTIGAYQNHILLKPKDDQDAKRILNILSDTTHQVISTIHIIDTLTKKFLTKTVITEVSIDKISDEEIDEYIASGEGRDKAAAYAIQGVGAKYVRSIKGDYFNVVGLPINTLYNMLKELV